MAISQGGEIATPDETRALRCGRGRDRAAGGDSRPASWRIPGATSRTVRSRRSWVFQPRSGCGWSRREPRRSRDSSPSRAGHRARAGRAPGDRAARRVISPGRGPASGPVKPRHSRSAAAARMSKSWSSGRTTQGVCSPGASTMCRRNRLPRRSISRSVRLRQAAGWSDTGISLQVRVGEIVAGAWSWGSRSAGSPASRERACRRD